MATIADATIADTTIADTTIAVPTIPNFPRNVFEIIGIIKTRAIILSELRKYAVKNKDTLLLATVEEKFAKLEVDLKMVSSFIDSKN